MTGAGDPRDRQDRSLPTWLARVLAIGAGIASVTACSIILDWGGYSGGVAKDGGAAPIACGNDRQCANVVPGDASAGWEGPLALYGAGGSPVNCDGDGGYAQYFVVDASVACSACSCAPPVGGACADPVITYYATLNDAGCQAPCAETPLPVTQCVAPSLCGTAFDIGPPTVLGGTCATAGGVPSKSGPWQLAARACPTVPSLTTGSCAPGEVCLSTPANPTAARVCIRREGVATACPAGAYQYGPEIYFTDITSLDDTRGCAPCTCSPPASASCDYPVLTVPNLRCNGVPVPFTVPTSCQYLDPNNPSNPMNVQGFQVNAAPRFDAGHCVPSGGEPVPDGGVKPTSTPTSFCCTAAP